MCIRDRGLQLGERVGGIAGDILDLDVGLLLEGRDDLLAHGLFVGAAIAGDIKRLLLGESGGAGECGSGNQSECDGEFHGIPSSFSSDAVRFGADLELVKSNVSRNPCRNVMFASGGVSMLNPRQIEAFRTVIVTGGITAAAQALNVTQPAVTRLIQDLSLIHI